MSADDLIDPRKYTFDSYFITGSNFNQKFVQDEVKNEPMFFSAGANYARYNGGPITRAFLRALEKDRPDIWDDIIFDSRVHMLMPNWYPCIPGYHHDDVPRFTENGQPNYYKPEYQALHCLGMINGEICPTEFAIGLSKFELPEVGADPRVYKKWHPEVVSLLERGVLQKREAPSDRLVFFNHHAWHQGTPAKKSGWRWFGRATWNTKRKVTNEIRRQVQVYMEDIMEGW